MPRRKKEGVSFKRDIGVDTRYGSPVIQKLINVIMWRGKKNAARTIVYDAIDVLIKKSNGDQNKALELFFRALDQLVPHVEVRPRRVGGSVYQIPMEVNPDRARALAMRWLIGAAKERSDKTMGIRLAYELLEAVEGRGGAVKKKIDVHRMAEANRAFSHYAW
ncbi:30S ribosomal protein S7 [Candidatus Dependentiae bacterium Noda2021]|nr:30S ribosomal protein S7 [Candidatus Dependentiae bacterium Noda2021]